MRSLLDFEQPETVWVGAPEGGYEGALLDRRTTTERHVTEPRLVRVARVRVHFR